MDLIPLRLVTLVVAVAFIAGCESQDPKNPKNPAPAKNIEWTNQERIEIQGYSGNAMEPKLFAREQLLFFNDKPENDAQMDIHYARRVSATQYQYLGRLSGADQAGTLDGVPAIDRDLNFYFVSLRNYATNFSTVFGGKLVQTGGFALVNVSVRDEALVRPLPGQLIMDIDVTPDGRFMILSRAAFESGGSPSQSDLELAGIENGRLIPIAQSAALLSKINTSQHLEYAGTLSADGLEFYFTRYLEPKSPGKLDSFRIMVSKRSSPSEVFGEPLEIAGISGQVTEAPALSDDGLHLYFHKLTSAGRYELFRVARAEVPPALVKAAHGLEPSSRGFVAQAVCSSEIGKLVGRFVGHTRDCVSDFSSPEAEERWVAQVQRFDGTGVVDDETCLVADSLGETTDLVTIQNEFNPLMRWVKLGDVALAMDGDFQRRMKRAKAVAFCGLRKSVRYWTFHPEEMPESKELPNYLFDIRSGRPERTRLTAPLLPVGT